MRQNTIEARLLNERGLPNFGLNFYIVSKQGEYAGVSLYEGARFAVCDENGPRIEACTGLLQGAANP